MHDDNKFIFNKVKKKYFLVLYKMNKIQDMGTYDENVNVKVKNAEYPQMRISSTFLIPIHLYPAYNCPNTLTKFLCFFFLSSIKDPNILNFCKSVGIASITNLAPTESPGSMDMGVND